MPAAVTIAQAEEVRKTSPEQAIPLYQTILANAGTGMSSVPCEGARNDQETALLKLAQCYRDLHRPNELAALIHDSRTLITSIPKAKTAKIIRTLIDYFSEIPNTLPLQIDVCKQTIQWTIQEKRIFLKQALETRLIALYLDNKMYSDSLALVATLLKELKKLDDKMVLVEVQLLESRVCHALRNLPKAKAALTSARTSANAIYCPPLLQAALDMQSGILHAEEKDYKTAFSYFYETLEGYSSLEDPRAISALKYMLLCKVMLNLSEDIQSILNSKVALKYRGIEVEAMKAIASAHQNRSLQEFEQALAAYRSELGNDPIIRNHLESLYDKLLEQNLVRVIEPFSRVEISHIAEIIKLPAQQVETKLSQMILDKTFHGVLDQGAGCLVVFEETPVDKTYDGALETMKNMANVVESLYEKASKLT
ncbi:26S proteasome regulatory subunit rpn6 [Lunasporangiospora selenospora]|uniref:26S proteasome regulatory subunit rpn6 n=1 Tax=Lunasporangiospora selenospora TaxID=979761 RepID=A0A9P6FP83_9FUNG|nr:26S proteasome regulatory subunit rpn6 [Lunasporangiospora selenospora]